MIHSVHRLLLILLFIGHAAFAQVSNSGSNPTIPAKIPLRDRLFFGGNVGLSFGSLTFIQLAPLVGVRLTDKFGVGLGPSYSYYSDRRDSRLKFTTETYGGRVFAQYRVHQSIMLYTEYELLNAEVPDLLYTRLERRNISSLFVGGGYLAPIGQRSAVMISVLYNLLEDSYSPYENPVFRTGFVLGM
jgi:hypothetical protein